MSDDFLKMYAFDEKERDKNMSQRLIEFMEAENFTSKEAFAAVLHVMTWMCCVYFSKKEFEMVIKTIRSSYMESARIRNSSID